MKPTTKATFLGAILAAASFMVLSPPGVSQTQQVVLPVEQYRVVDITKFRNPQLLEQELNRPGSEGWRVRAGAMGALVVAK